VMPSLETPKKEGIDYFLLDKQRDVIVFMAWPQNLTQCTKPQLSQYFSRSGVAFLIHNIIVCNRQNTSKPKIRRRRLFAYLTIYHIFCKKGSSLPRPTV
jgi:hypothetical protein